MNTVEIVCMDSITNAWLCMIQNLLANVGSVILLQNNIPCKNCGSTEHYTDYSTLTPWLRCVECDTIIDIAIVTYE